MIGSGERSHRSSILNCEPSDSEDISPEVRILDPRFVHERAFDHSWIDLHGGNSFDFRCNSIQSQTFGIPDTVEVDAADRGYFGKIACKEDIGGEHDNEDRTPIDPLA